MVTTAINDIDRIRRRRPFAADLTCNRIDGIVREVLKSRDRASAVRDQSDNRTGPNQEETSTSEDLHSEKPKEIRVLIADDHPVVREGLVAVVNRHPGMRVIAEAENGREALENYRSMHPDVALLDVRMPVMNGIETVSAICHDDPAARVVMVTTFESEEEIYRALRAGARGYILKNAGLEDLIRCIQAVGAGRTWIPPEVGAKLAKRVTDQQLTMREMDVLRAVALGKSNKEIGCVFNISEATVKVHMTHIFEKLKVTGRTEAINVAVKRGLVRMDETPAA